MNKNLKIIVAVDRSGGFGKEGKIPWFFKCDFKHFKEVTTGHVCVMGRRTYTDMVEMAKERDRDISESILPNRECFVVSNSLGSGQLEGAERVNGLRDLMDDKRVQDKTIMVLGGERLFLEALPWANTIYITTIDDDFECDRFFQLEYVQKHFNITEGTTEEEDGTTLYFNTLTRK